MIANHAVLEVHWDGQSHAATGDRQHELGCSVRDGGEEKGLVAGWRFDGETLSVESDPFGYLPLFVYADHTRIVVGTSPIALVAAGAPGDLDREAIGFFVRIGFHLGERTPFKHVRLAPRGQRLVWSRGVERLEGAGLTVVPASIRSVEEGVDGYCDLFRTAMRRRPPTHERFGMPLSGGRDSRMMLLDSIALGHRPAACLNLSSSDGSDHPDAVIARQLAARVNVPLVVAEGRSPRIVSEARKHVMGGLLAVEHAWIMPLWDTLRASYSCWYDGLGVGVLTRSDLCKPSCWQKYQRGDWTELFRELASFAVGISDDAIRRIAPRADWIEPSEASAVALMRAEFDRCAGAANPLTRFGFMNWGARAIATSPFMLCAPVRDIHLPFMDADLVRFVLAYPIELALKDDLQTACVRRMHPSFADIPFDKDLPQWKRTRTPLGQAVASRIATARHMMKHGGRFRALGLTAALAGNARMVTMLMILAFLERASTQDGAAALLNEFGLGSPADRDALARHRIR